MDVRDLIQKAMKATGDKSFRQLGKRIGVSGVALGRYAEGTRFPDFETCAELAALAGLDPITTAAEVRLKAPEGMRHSAMLKRLAAKAAAILAGFGLAAGSTPSQALTLPADTQANAHYVALLLRRLREIFGPKSRRDLHAARRLHSR